MIIFFFMGTSSENVKKHFIEEYSAYSTRKIRMSKSVVLRFQPNDDNFVWKYVRVLLYVSLLIQSLQKSDFSLY